MIDTVAAHILGLPVWVALLLVFAMPALESSAFVGFVFPGEVALILGGVIAYEGRISLLAVLAAGVGGAIIGDSVGYLVGRRYGRGLLEGTLGRFINHKHFDQAERYLAERGGKAVFFGRFTAALRVMIPGLAGMSRMRYPKFAAYNISGGVSWGAMCVLLGYAGGSSWRHVEHLASRIGLGALLLVVLGFGAVFALRHSRSGWAQRLLARVSASRAMTWLVHRFPRTVGWVTRRLDPSSRLGLPLTAVVAAGVAASWLFGGITQDVVAREELAALDPRVHTWVLDHRVAWLNPVMQAATWLGSNAVLLPVLLVAAIVLGRRRSSWHPAVSIVVVYAWAVLLHAMVVELVNRNRPPAVDWLAGATGPSYPSGHTIQAATAYGILLVLFLPGTSRRVWGVLTTAVVAIVLLVAISRVYLGVHWLTDVLGSLTLGVALLCVWGITRLTVTRDDMSGRSDNYSPDSPGPRRTSGPAA